MCEWREVRRKGTTTRRSAAGLSHGRIDDSSLTSFFISNLPGDVNKLDLRMSCAPLGNLKDIYIAGRRDCSGSFFAFAKFADVVNLEDMESRLNKIIFRGRKLVANVAKHPRPLQPKSVRMQNATGSAHFSHPPWDSRASGQRDSRSFAEVISGKGAVNVGVPPPPLIKVQGIQEIKDWIGKSAVVGEVKSFDILCNFPSLLELEGYDVIESRYIGGMQILIKFRSDRAAEVFKANKSIWLKWFLWVEFYGKKCTRFERVAWIKITGLPIQSWDESNFDAIAQSFGKVLVNSNPFWNSMDVSTGKMGILTARRSRINEEVNIDYDGEVIKIGVFETDDCWTPFRPFLAREESDSEEDSDEEAVSDTWHHDGTDFEEGEFIPVGEGLAGNAGDPVGQGDGAEAEGVHTVSPFPKEGPRVLEPHALGVTTDGSPMHCGSDIPHASGPVHNSPPVGPHLSPVGILDTSSPEYEPGESGLKRRRTKLKIRGNSQSRQNLPRSSMASDAQAPLDRTQPVPAPSIDLNRQASPPKHSANQVNNISSPSRSSLSSSSVELDRTVDVGTKVGFQISRDNPALLDAARGGGGKTKYP
ncbi:hypothetical protein L2E82_06906 [Cichorium intybus]|uniref:Uncharacterized protein n=1 Tax=Cichorium intybus TaxID=13427 RepID=A0ACB9G412_CICIN|nr:hypothetical protein L2E82_06906 [Cichorium intybus]